VEDAGLVDQPKGDDLFAVDELLGVSISDADTPGAIEHGPGKVSDSPQEGSGRDESPATAGLGMLPITGPRTLGGPTDAVNVVRARFGELRRCYEAGRSRNPKLRGRVAMRFVIERTGMVRDARALDTSFADKEVTRCIVDAFSRLTFSAPTNGPVTVTYPIRLSAGGLSTGLVEWRPTP
jgi:hypothetical protein